MPVRSAKTASGNVVTGRHRLPRNLEPAAPVLTPLHSSRCAGVEDDDFDDERSSSPCETPVDHSQAQDEDAANTALRTADSSFARVIAFGLLPILTVLLGGGAGYLTWGAVSARFVQQARVESVRAATDGTLALLTYRPDTVVKDVSAARELLTGKFKASYTLFTHQHVIPDASTNHISSVVTVPAAALVQATIHHAVVLVFVNQTFLHDPDPPTSTASDVRVTLDKVGRRWLISEFTPF